MDSKRSKMLKHLRRWQREGVSLREYSRSHGVVYSQLVYWRQRLQEELQSAQGDSVAFVEVEVAESPKESQSCHLEVQVSNGRVIRVLPGFDDHEVRRLVLALEQC